MPTASIAELGTHLLEQGIEAEPIRVAAALIGLARAQGWVSGDGVHASSWLGDIAAEVARGWREQSTCPALDVLQQWLTANKVAVDSRKVASALLGLAHEEEWNSHPEHLIDWFARASTEVDRHNAPGSAAPKPKRKKGS